MQSICDSSLVNLGYYAINHDKKKNQLTAPIITYLDWYPNIFTSVLTWLSQRLIGTNNYQVVQVSPDWFAKGGSRHRSSQLWNCSIPGFGSGVNKAVGLQWYSIQQSVSITDVICRMAFTPEAQSTTNVQFRPKCCYFGRVEAQAAEPLGTGNSRMSKCCRAGRIQRCSADSNVKICHCILWRRVGDDFFSEMPLPLSSKWVLFCCYSCFFVFLSKIWNAHFFLLQCFFWRYTISCVLHIL